jgi:hypothetical protein
VRVRVRVRAGVRVRVRVGVRVRVRVRVRVLPTTSLLISCHVPRTFFVSNDPLTRVHRILQLRS